MSSLFRKITGNYATFTVWIIFLVSQTICLAFAAVVMLARSQYISAPDAPEQIAIAPAITPTIISAIVVENIDLSAPPQPTEAFVPIIPITGEQESVASDDVYAQADGQVASLDAPTAQQEDVFFDKPLFESLSEVMGVFLSPGDVVDPAAEVQVAEDAAPTQSSIETQPDTAAPTSIIVPTATVTDIVVPTSTATNTPAAVAQNAAIATATPEAASNTTNSLRPTSTPTSPATATSVPTDTPTATLEPTATAEPTATSEPTATNTNTPVPTATATNTATPTNTPTPLNTATPTATNTPAATSTPTNTPTPTAAPASADLSLRILPPVGRACGDAASITYRVSNGGDDPATGVTLTGHLPSVFTGASTDQDGCSVNGSNLSCTFKDPLETGSYFDVIFDGAFASSPCYLSIEASGSVGSDVSDPVSFNNNLTLPIILSGNGEDR